LLIGDTFIPCADDCATADAYFFVNDYLVQKRTRANPRVIHHYAVFDHRAGTHIDAWAEYTVDHHTANNTAIGDHAAHHLALWAEFGGGPFFRLRMDRPLVGIEIKRRLRLEQIQIGCPISIHRSDIYPISFIAISEYPISGSDHRWNDILAKVYPRRTFTPLAKP